jgi:hypothetical protein
MNKNKLAKWFNTFFDPSRPFWVVCNLFSVITWSMVILLTVYSQSWGLLIVSVWGIIPAGALLFLSQKK